MARSPVARWRNARRPEQPETAGEAVIRIRARSPSCDGGVKSACAALRVRHLATGLNASPEPRSDLRSRHARPEGAAQAGAQVYPPRRSEEHTSELQSLMRTTYAI